jgi:hypothetical protein
VHDRRADPTNLALYSATASSRCSTLMVSSREVRIAVALDQLLDVRTDAEA